MLKLIISITLALFGALIVTGCGQSEIEPQMPRTGSNSWAQSSANDVDVSDIDNILTESEMMMTSQSGGQKAARIPFPSSEYTQLQRIGKGTVKGTIFLRSTTGGEVVGSETRLYLNPVTSYSEQWYEKSYVGGSDMEKADPRLFNYLKFTASNASGHFAFYGVPAGSYYLIGTVKCGQECGYSGNKNIRIAKKISIQGNQIIETDLSRTAE